MSRMAGVRVASFLALAACYSFCQSKESGNANLLPSAPTPQAHLVLPAFARILPSANSPVYFLSVQFHGSSSKLNDHSVWAIWNVTDKEHPNENDQFHRQLVALLQHRATYQPSSDDRVVARAASAALGTFFRRDPSGRTRLKTSYVLGVLTSAMIHTAYRPYWNRPVSAPFSDFGSTLGNDAGMNLLHEFGPSLEQLMKSHTPKFVSRIEASIERK
jgi:hypothetical protein